MYWVKLYFSSAAKGSRSTLLCDLHPSSSGIQACSGDPVMLCDRPGRALAVCVNPDQSPPLLDGQRHEHKEKVTGCTQARPDEVSKEVSTEHWTAFTACNPEEEFLWWKNQMTTLLKYFCSNSPVTRCGKSIKTLYCIDWYSTGSYKLPDVRIVTGTQFSNDTCKYSQQLTLL